MTVPLIAPTSPSPTPTNDSARQNERCARRVAVTDTLHGVLILNGWAQWSLRRFLGYEFVPQLGREARLEPGFELANLIGIVALVLALVLAATSSDRARARVRSWIGVSG